MIYRRYFRIKDAKTLEAIRQIRFNRDLYNIMLRAVIEKIGAENAWTNEECLTGFSFPKGHEVDRRIFKPAGDNRWLPKKTVPEGKELWHTILSAPFPLSLRTALGEADLSTSRFCLSDGGRIYGCTVCGHESVGWFAIVPWTDVDPADLEQYRKDRDEGSRGDGDLDHLLWTPPVEWDEVKEYVVDKAIAEAQELADKKVAGRLRNLSV